VRAGEGKSGRRVGGIVGVCWLGDCGGLAGDRGDRCGGCGASGQRGRLGPGCGRRGSGIIADGIEGGASASWGWGPSTSTASTMGRRFFSSFFLVLHGAKNTVTGRESGRGGRLLHGEQNHGHGAAAVDAGKIMACADFEHPSGARRWSTLDSWLARRRRRPRSRRRPRLGASVPQAELQIIPSAGQLFLACRHILGLAGNRPGRRSGAGGTGHDAVRCPSAASGSFRGRLWRICSRGRRPGR